MDDRDEGGSWGDGGEHRDDVPESSPHEGESGVDPNRPFGHVNPSAPPSYEPSQYESYGGGPQGPDVPREPLEPLNPWISIVSRPRATIRYVLDTGVWNSWIIVYTILFLITVPPAIVGIFAQPNPIETFQMQEAPFGLPDAVFILIVMVPSFAIIYPIALLLVAVKAWLYRIFGSWLGGTGLTAECRTAIVWGGAVQKYFSYVALIPNIFIIVYYLTTPDYPDAATIFLPLGVMAISFPFWVYGLIIHSRALAEAHHFSAWSGFGATLIMAALEIAIGIGMVIAIFIAAVALGFAAAAAS